MENNLDQIQENLQRIQEYQNEIEKKVRNIEKFPEITHFLLREIFNYENIIYELRKENHDIKNK